MSTFTTTFQSITFTATSDAWSEEATSEVNVIGFPGGDAVAISIGGQRETRRTLKVLLDDIADYRTFRDMRAKAGHLLIDNWDAVAVSAVLVSVRPDAPWMSGEITCTAQFLVY